MTLSAPGPEPKTIRRGGLPTGKDVQNLGRRLLAWYDRNRRDLPWRARPGESSDPYRVWVSEVMLQQTTVAATIPYYERFIARFPTVDALAAADLDKVLRLWAGLGYYARARNLHACARAVVDRHGGHFPRSPAALRDLPGIGAYTAAAVAAIAFDECTVPVDGNVERVVARLFAIKDPLPQGRAVIRRAAERLAPGRRGGDFAQALMDLGATLCTPRFPACPRCPLRAACAAAAHGDPAAFPAKEAKRPRRLRRGAAFVVLRGGMAEVPTTEWTHAFDEQAALDHAPALCPSSLARLRRARPSPRLREEGGERHDCEPGEGRAVLWRRAPGVVSHVFTHFPLELVVFVANAPAGAKTPRGMRWVARAELDREALPNLIRKVIAHADLVRGGDADARASEVAGLKRTPPAPRRAVCRSR
jgi:A/G-specific adenine glycosylase